VVCPLHLARGRRFPAWYCRVANEEVIQTGPGTRNGALESELTTVRIECAKEIYHLIMVEDLLPLAPFRRPHSRPTPVVLTEIGIEVTNNTMIEGD
jgi:hypothetical protein